MTVRARRRYDVSVDGYRIRNDADLDRVDMSKSERRWKHRKAKLEKRAEASIRSGEASCESEIQALPRQTSLLTAEQEK